MNAGVGIGFFAQRGSTGKSTCTVDLGPVLRKVATRDNPIITIDDENTGQMTVWFGEDHESASPAGDVPPSATDGFRGVFDGVIS